MAKRKLNRRPDFGAAPTPKSISMLTPALDANTYLPGPKLRQMLGISPVTLWRWRRDADFPVPKVIRKRTYFPWHAVSAWLAKQQEAA